MKMKKLSKTEQEKYTEYHKLMTSMKTPTQPRNEEAWVTEYRDRQKILKQQEAKA